MPGDVDPELIIDAILLHVDDMEDDQEGSGVAWLRTEFDRVLTETMGGAVFCKLSIYQTAQSQFDQGMPSQELLAILTQVRKRLNSDANGSPAAGAMMIPRFDDFPLSRC